MTPIPVVFHRPDREDLVSLDVLRQARRAESRRLVRVLEAMPTAGTSRTAAEVRVWSGHVRDAAAHLRHVEEAALLPLLVAAYPAASGLAAAVHRDHEVLAARFEDLAWSLAALEGRPAGPPAPVLADALTVARDVVALVDEQWDVEETALVPLVLHHVDRPALLDALAAADRAVDHALLPFLAGWVLPHCTEDQLRLLRSRLPVTVRLLARRVWQPRYERTYPTMVADRAPADPVMGVAA